MRILKKSMAITLVVAMVLGLMSFGTFATETNDMALRLVANKASVGQGQDVTVELQLKSNTGSNIPLAMTGVSVVYDNTKWTVENITEEGMLYYTGTVAVQATKVTNATAGGGTLTPEFVTAAKYRFTAKDDATVGPDSITLDEIAYSTGAMYDTVTNDTPDALNITIVETAVINTVTAPVAISDKTIGTAVADLGLPSTVVVATATKESPVGQNVNVAWDTTAYDAAVLTEQRFTGTVTTGNDAWTLAGDFVAPTITVTLQPATDAVVSAPANVEIKATKEDTVFDKAAYKAIVGDTIELEVAKGDIEDVVVISDEWITVTDVDTTVADATTEDAISITIPANTMSKANKFKIAETTLTADVLVVPAEIEGATVEIKGATTANDKVVIKATVPAATIAVPTGDSYIYGAGYEAVWSDAKAAVDAMTIAMGRGSSDAANVDNKTMYVGLDSLEIDAKYGVKVFKGEEEVTFGEGNVMEFTNESKNEVVFYWTFNTENPDGATEDVVDAGVYTIKAYKNDVEFDSIDVTVGEAEVLGDAPVKYEGTFTLAIDEGAAVLEDTHTYSNDYVIGTDVDVTVEGETATVELKADKKLSEILSDDSVDTAFTVSVYYNNAALVVGQTEGGANILGVTGKVMATFSDNNVGGIGVSQGNVKLPEKTEEPGTEEPGTEEPGTEEPGTEEPGTEEPGTDAPAVDAPFADITEAHAWAVESIATLKDLGVINGNENGAFEPDADITRAEYAKMIAGAFGLEATATESAFVDCPADAWFTPYVVACTEAGYILGVSETEFAPEAPITREQACAILGRALNAAAEGELAFTDAAEVEEYAKAYIVALVEMGLVNGYEDGSFAPANNITRAEAAKIIAGAIAAQGEEAPAEEAPAE